MKDCWFCEGTGKCPECKGEGYHDCPTCGTTDIPCPLCNGSCKCDECGGTGKVEEND